MLRTIIVVDDSVTARMIIKRCLQIAGCRESRFLEAGNGLQAMELAQTNEVDLIVTDLNMPKMDGASLLKRLKISPDLSSLPVFIVSSACNPARQSELIESGAFAVLHKPISPANLATKIQTLHETKEWGDA